MATITIRERQQTEQGFEVTVSFGQGEYPITVADPFSVAEERRLEWYFEQWIRFPFTEKVRAAAAAASVKNYGLKLFEQVFRSDVDIYAQYRELRNGKLSDIEISIESQSPEFQGLHWEALQDPDLEEPLAVSCTIARRPVRSPSFTARVKESPYLNLLLVTARPGEEDDVGYRTVSRPLIEAIEQAELPVRVEILRPATYEVLDKHLQGKEGHYHIVHFDTHGALLTYEQVKALRESEKKEDQDYIYYQGYDNRPVPEYAGYKAFLLLEAGGKGKANLVEADTLADLLKGKGVPVCVLNACQSGKQVLGSSDAEDAEAEANPDADAAIVDACETSLASRLMAAGLQTVVAMGYTVTVTAAALFMKRLYAQLLNEQPLPDSIRAGRRELYKRKQRRAYANQMVDLEDWLLPVAYCNAVVDLNLQSFTDEEEEKFYEKIASRYRFEEPTYGFVGRDLDILKLERALDRHNILLLQGMGGTGKTTLLLYLRQWWQATHFAKDIFYFGYDERAYTAEQIVYAVGQQVYPRYEAARFQAMPSLPAKVAKLTKFLRANSYVLMLDNLESVTGQPLAIQNTLPPEEQAALKDFLTELKGGSTKVVLGSRSPERWLEPVFDYGTGINRYVLKGLDPEARSHLAQAILVRQGKCDEEIADLRQDGAFKRLMKLLAGYPLAMEVVLANLRQQGPEEVLAALQGQGVALNEGGEARTDSIVKCVEYSHSNLSPEAQKLLLCLAPLSSFFRRDTLPYYVKQLKQQAAFADYPFERFDEAIDEAVSWGLLSPLQEEMPQLLSIQPVFPYFLNAKLKGLDEATREGLRQGFKAHYTVLGKYYDQLIGSKKQQERQTGLTFCRLEYENLSKALQICFENQEDASIAFCLEKFLRLTNDAKNRFVLVEDTIQKLEAYSEEFLAGKLGYQFPFFLERLGDCQINAQLYPEAQKSFQKALDFYKTYTAVELEQKQRWIAADYHQLGMVAQEQRQWQQANDYYNQALAIDIEYGDRYSQASTYHQLGIVAQAQRQWQQANDYYQQALAIKIEYGDRYSQASTYHQLGRVAEAQRQWQQANDYYKQALAINIEYGDRYSQARTYHQLGMVA
ncbi:MAG: tetratricopeptide repeat protein, partial [Cyanobacteria bacterium P01_A01_bin.135]